MEFTVGLFNEDARIYFVNNEFVVMNDPHNGGVPTLVKRHKGGPTKEDWVKIKSALALVEMTLVGYPCTREDGLWCHPVQGGNT